MTPRALALARLVGARLGPNIAAYDRLDGPYCWREWDGVYWRFCCLEWPSRAGVRGQWIGVN